MKLMILNKSTYEYFPANFIVIFAILFHNIWQNF